MPENAKRRLRGEGAAGGDGANVRTIVTADADPARELAAFTGCPCGCRSSAWYADPDCVTRRPMPEPVDWPVSNVEQLGLVPHNRSTCSSCRAVAS
jgi:hypothetical protein